MQRHPPLRSKIIRASIFRGSVLRVSILMGLCWNTAGCSDGKPKAYPTRGRVVFRDGSPVKVGTVECKSELYGVQATGTIDRDGSFVLSTYQDGDGAVEGPHQCVVVQFIQVENTARYKPSTLGVVHRKHGSYATSGLSIRVSPNQNNELLLQVDGAGGAASTSQHGPQHTHPGDFVRE